MYITILLPNNVDIDWTRRQGVKNAQSTSDYIQCLALSIYLWSNRSTSKRKHFGRQLGLTHPLLNINFEFHPSSSRVSLPFSLEGVVDPSSTLRVYESANVRVMDLSVFPIEMSAHTGTPTDGSGVNVTDNNSGSRGSGSAGSGRDTGGGAMAIMGGVENRRDDGRVYRLIITSNLFYFHPIPRPPTRIDEPAKHFSIAPNLDSLKSFKL
ncbi:hypothetical protein K435DRAFT_970059 [Dendrothele bispora CBS 962.96]|uniref:Glucose-methanol-choline oxidoreductase C-terminal domain-containing protein n=1 Tax=Dendrothele bispora (strain CBS 962.96) TaxID=1314807 RepID=A0A4S8LDT1_DENBC|nr:hypothetical protein K435DRAFT_970059 [Dendrothele bispora CBS 962.96]